MRSSPKLITFLCVSAAVVYGLAYFFPMWSFWLTSPQYPQGLILSISLNGVTGDTTEINIINHYIGMSRLDSAAQLERSLAGYGIAFVSVSVGLMGFVGLRSIWAVLLSLPAISFPVLFLVRMYMWMYRFGHNLDPAAPVDIPPFTPTLLGSGKIGQFQTVAVPAVGFYLVLGGALMAAYALFFAIRAKHRRT